MSSIEEKLGYLDTTVPIIEKKRQKENERRTGIVEVIKVVNSNQTLLKLVNDPYYSKFFERFGKDSRGGDELYGIPLVGDMKNSKSGLLAYTNHGVVEWMVTLDTTVSISEAAAQDLTVMSIDIQKDFEHCQSEGRIIDLHGSSMLFFASETGSVDADYFRLKVNESLGLFIQKIKTTFGLSEESQE